MYCYFFVVFVLFFAGAFLAAADSDFFTVVLFAELFFAGAAALRSAPWLFTKNSPPAT